MLNINEPTSLNLSLGAKYARKYGSKTNNSSVTSSSSHGSHTSRILNKSKAKTIDSHDKGVVMHNELDGSFQETNEIQKNSRNYRIKIKRPKSAFFTSSSSNAISKPGNSPSPPPVLRQTNTDQLQNNAFNNTTSINPYAYLKNSYKKNSRGHYFYTKEEMADYQDHVALNQMFMSKTCHNFVAASNAIGDAFLMNNNGVDNMNSSQLQPAQSSPIRSPTSSKSNSMQTKSSKTNRYSSNKSNFLFNKQR